MLNLAQFIKELEQYYKNDCIIHYNIKDNYIKIDNIFYKFTSYLVKNFYIIINKDGKVKIVKEENIFNGLQSFEVDNNSSKPLHKTKHTIIEETYIYNFIDYINLTKEIEYVLEIEFEVKTAAKLLQELKKN